MDRFEIERNRIKIAEARKRAFEKLKEDRNSADAPPEGFFSPKKLDCYIKEDLLFSEALRDFMLEIGICNFSLERFFWKEKTLGLTKKHSAYRLIFKSSTAIIEKEDEDRSPVDQKNSVWIFFDPGTHMSVSKVLSLVPFEKPDISLDVEQAVGFLNSNEKLACFYRYFYISKVSKQNIRNLLTLIVSNPELEIEFGDPKEEF